MGCHRGSSGVWFSWLLRFAGRFILLRWLCVRWLCSPSRLRLQQGLTTAQGVTLVGITPAVMPGTITIVAIIDTSPAHRAGSAVWRRCRRGILPTPRPVSNRTPPLRPWPRRVVSAHRISLSPRRGVISGGNPTGRGQPVVRAVHEHGAAAHRPSRHRLRHGEFVRQLRPGAFPGRRSGPSPVMSRGRGGGHVGIITGDRTRQGNPTRAISGNNGNRVREAPVSRGRTCAYVMPNLSGRASRGRQMGPRASVAPTRAREDGGSKDADGGGHGQ